MPEQNLTGYPSIDKPWLKYYSEEAINAPQPECTIYEYLWENNKEHLDDIALNYFGKKITYRKLFENIDRVACSLLSIGVKENDVVTLLMLNQPETVYLFYAINKIGAVVCVVNVLSSSKELTHYLSECNSDYFITLDLFFEKAYKAAKKENTKKLIYLSMFETGNIFQKATYRIKVKKPDLNKDDFAVSWETFLKCQSERIVQAEYKKQKCAVIGHTGGTTGTPKGVEISDDSFNVITQQYSINWNHKRQETFLDIIVPFAIYGLAVNLHMPLCCGVTVVLIPKVIPQKTYKLLFKYKPNHIISIPSYWESVVNCKRLKNMSFLKTAGAGGAKMDCETEIKLNMILKTHGSSALFLNGYGMSEVCSTACVQNTNCAETGSVGIPLPHVIISAFDIETGKEKTIGDEGEICINSPSCMLKYVNNEDETQNIMRRHPDGKVWIHTGDLGYISERGSAFITGRIKRIYITQVNGTVSKIFPDRIEKLLSEDPAVSNCCVVCTGNAKETYKPVAFIVLKQEYRDDIQKVTNTLKCACKANLPDYAQPIKYIFKKSLPLTSVGKIDYRALEKQAEEIK